MFESSLIESGKQQLNTKRFLSVPLSVGIHVVVLVLAAGVSLWYIEEIPEPPIPVTFYAQSAPPPPPPPPPPKAAAAQKQAEKIEPVKQTQITLSLIHI